MGFFSTVGNIAKKAAPIAGVAASFLPGGGFGTGLVKTATSFLGKNAGKIAGVAGGIQAAASQRGGQQMQNRAVQMAERDYAERAPIRQRQQQMLMSGQPQRQDITLSPVQRGAGIPGQTSGAQQGLASQTNQAANNLAGWTRSAYTGVGANDNSNAGSLATRAEQAYDGASMGERREIAGTDFSGARREMEGMRLGDRARIAGTDLGRARSISGDAYNEVGNARLKDFGEIAATDASGAKRLLSQAEGRYSGLGYEDQAEIAAGTYAPSRGQNLARRYSERGLVDLNKAPSRAEIANSVFDTLEERSRPQFEQDLRKVGGRAAALGRLGAGMTTNDLTGVMGQRERDLRLSRQELSNDAAARELEDRTSRLNSSLAAGESFYGQDIGNAGMGLTLRNEARGERDFRVGMDERRIGLGFRKAEMDRALGNDDFSINRAVRDDLVGERGFQADRDALGADLALRRSSAYSGLADQESNFAQITRRDAESDRSYDLDYDSRSADLAGRRAGMESEFANTARRDSESDREYGAEFDSRNADLSLRRGSAYQGLGQDAFSRGQSMRTEARGEADRRSRFDLDGMDAERSRLGSLASLEGQRFGQESDLRDESRRERAYGDSRSDLQNDREVLEMEMEDARLAGDTNRYHQLVQALGAAGGDSPAGMLYGAGADREAGARDDMAQAGEFLARQGSGSKALTRTPSSASPGAVKLLGKNQARDATSLARPTNNTYENYTPRVGTRPIRQTMRF